MDIISLNPVLDDILLSYISQQSTLSITYGGEKILLSNFTLMKDTPSFMTSMSMITINVYLLLVKLFLSNIKDINPIINICTLSLKYTQVTPFFFF